MKRVNNTKLTTLLLASVAPLYGAAAAEEIVVRSTLIERNLDDTIYGTSVLTDEALKLRLESTIGETLRREPGISSTFFGPGASRPVIRGLAGDRIRVLNAGIGSIDAAATSPDHAVSIEPATTERIEVIRGAATLLYGSSGAGGVVNVFDGRIPTDVPEDGIDGVVRFQGATADRSFETAGGVDLDLIDANEGNLVLHLDGFFREAENYQIPGFAESAILRASEEEEGGDDDEEAEEMFGAVENTTLETIGGAAGLSWIFENGFFGVSASIFESEYGVPGEHGHHEEEGGEEEEEEEEGGVTLDLEQVRVDVAGEINGDFFLFETVKVRFGYADYEHIEIEPSGEAGTVFSNEGWEGRLEFVDKTMEFAGGELNGAFGVQLRSRDYSAVGEEAFVPLTESNQYGVFALKEYSTGPLRFDLSGRYERTDHDVTEDPTLDRTFDAFSVSAGVGYKPIEGLFVGVSGFRTERAPAIEELYSDGAHLATNTFEIGDPTFDEEVGLGVEGTMRYSTDRFYAAITGFYTDYSDFIFEAATGDEAGDLPRFAMEPAEEEIAELPVFQFFAADAEFRGFEAELGAQLFEAQGFSFSGDATFDYVRATTSDPVNENLPRIPPMSGIVGVQASSDWLDLRTEVEFATRQDEVAAVELPTEGYQIVNAYATLRPFTLKEQLSFRLALLNATDEDARLHTSFLKDIAPLPGRNLRFSIEGSF
ncbi:MAG: TonB-dependent receptor [Pseudomonadota bacterium]